MLPEEQLHAIREDLDDAGVWRLHRRADARSGAASEPDMRGLSVTTMGRGPTDDPAFFSAAFAAGDIAFRVAQGTLIP
jgi:hypothetical protein